MDPGMRLVGRTAEVAALARGLARAQAAGFSVIVEGEPGIGKSALLEHAGTVAEGDGWTVLRCRGLEHERHLAFTGLGDLLSPIGERLIARLPEPQLDAIEVALLRRTPSATVGERAVGLGLTSLVSLVADDAPVLLLVDDAHWLDGATTRAIAFATRRLVGRPVAIIAGLRAPTAATAALERAMESGPSERLTVGPLDRDDLDELIQARLGRRLSLPRLTALHDATRGNPLLALEIAREVGDGAIDLRHGRVPVPDALRAALRHRIRRLSEHARRALTIVAISRPDRALVARLVGDGGDHAVDELLRSGAVSESAGRLDVFHPMLRSIVIADAGEAGTRRLHAELATTAGTEDERAWHRARAADGPDREVAMGLSAAASRAEDRGAAITAFELAADALQMTPAEDRIMIAERTLTAARLAFHAGDPGWAVDRLRRALDDAELPRRGELLHLLSRIEMQTDGILASIARLHEAEAAARSDYLRGRIAIDLANLSRSVASIDEALGHARRALEHGRAARHDGLLGEIHAILAALEFLAGRGVRHRRLALARALERREGRTGISVADQALAYQLLWAGYLADARELIQRIAATPEPEVTLHRVTPTWQLAVIEWRAGHWDESARLLDLSQRASDLAGRDAVGPMASWLRAVLAAHRGALGSARAILDEVEHQIVAASDRRAEQMTAWLRGFVELSTGHHDAAVSHLERFRDIALRADPGAAFEIPDLVESLVAVGRLDDAEAVLRPFEASAARHDRPAGLAGAARSRALLEAARGRPDDAAAVLSRWVAPGCMEEPFCIARNQLALGVIERRRKRKTTSRAALTAARDGFQRLGAVTWADRAADELARVGGGTAGLMDLTPTESRIADLAAAGRTNREIGEALFLSPKTVEWNLTRVYQKLGVRSRTELARRSSTDRTRD